MHGGDTAAPQTNRTESSRPPPIVSIRGSGLGRRLARAQAGPAQDVPVGVARRQTAPRRAPCLEADGDGVEQPRAHVELGLALAAPALPLTDAALLDFVLLGTGFSARWRVALVHLRRLV